MRRRVLVFPPSSDCGGLWRQRASAVWLATAGDSARKFPARQLCLIRTDARLPEERVHKSSRHWVAVLDWMARLLNAAPSGKMGIVVSLFLSLLFLAAQLLGGGGLAMTAGTDDGTEFWGYVKVRPEANMFWWYHKSPHRVSSPAQPWPTILWLQGGPGVSGVGHGNFLEIGPLDVNLNPRNSTWLQKADLLFVDSPVGVGYSYVEDPSALAKTDLQAALDVVELLKNVSIKIPALQSNPLFLVGESYGGKLAALIGVEVIKAIEAGTLNLIFGDVVLGDSWVSPDDYAVSYPLLLQSMSRLDDNAVGDAMRMAVIVKQQVAAGQFTAALKTFTGLMDIIDSKSGDVNLEDLRLDSSMSSMLPNSPGTNTLSVIMNGVIKEKLKIIPSNITWQETSLQVYDALANNFMRPAISEVDELLLNGLNVTIYNGQFDMICSTVGTEAWVKRLKWPGLANFLSLPRVPLYLCDFTTTFVRSYNNLTFYWILGAGHTVPVDQPCVALHIIGRIVRSPANN